MSVHPSSESPPSSPALDGREGEEEPEADSREGALAGAPGGPRSPHVVPGPVNTRAHAASNKAQRAKEAEEDRQLIARAQAGDMAAFRQLVERHQRRAFAIALALVRDENDARELVQDAFLRVFKSLHSFQGSSSFFTWLYRIITNLSIDLLRKPGHKLVEPDERRHEEEDQESLFPFVSRVEGADPVDVVRRREIGVRLQQALEALPPYHRGVIVMREVDGLSYEEMAQAMGVSKGTIMSRLFHARQKLQRALADCYAEQVGTPPESVDPASDVAPQAGRGAEEPGEEGAQ
ncbi:sigma-70 family RNA polymerase sigma factor [Pendulispora brunnea]|uniref:Sigma-70 family RNA polymerase sigma factor n=1 Tax=Pendulispora brunnea TaxID=2905690 RepID=A0ABZ2K159_9BACT